MPSPFLPNTRKLRAKPEVLTSIRHDPAFGIAAKLCRAAGGELEQIQMLLGHPSVQTTERYLGTKQDLIHPPNDGIKLRVSFGLRPRLPAGSVSLRGPRRPRRLPPPRDGLDGQGLMR